MTWRKLNSGLDIYHTEQICSLWQLNMKIWLFLSPCLGLIVRFMLTAVCLCCQVDPGQFLSVCELSSSRGPCRLASAFVHLCQLNYIPLEVPVQCCKLGHYMVKMYLIRPTLCPIYNNALSWHGRCFVFIIVKNGFDNFF